MIAPTRDKTDNLPSLSIIIVNRNSSKKLARSLRRIREQNYPKKLIEILVIDGGSTDNSKKTAIAGGAKFINGGYPENQEARRYVGAKKAKNEIIVWIDSDNYLPEKNWFRRMVEPLILDQKIFAAETLFYTYRRKDRAFNRYCSLFGINDPVAFYLGKADRATHYQRGWRLMGKAEDFGGYYKVTFEDDVPTGGCNGFLIRRKILNKVLTTPEEYFHIDVIFDLVKQGHKNIAFVKNGIIHDTSDSLGKLIKKRISYFSQHHIKQSGKRRYKVFDSKNRLDVLRLLLFLVYTITIVRPLFDSIRGYLKKPDSAWFLHPVVCWCFLYAYGISIVQSEISGIYRKNNKEET